MSEDDFFIFKSPNRNRLFIGNGVANMQIIEESLDQMLKQVAIRTNKVANRAEVEKSVRDIIANVAQNVFGWIIIIIYLLIINNKL